jgi:hypothetical protein
MDSIKESAEALLNTSKEVGLEVNPVKTKYMLVSRSQKIGRKYSIKIERSRPLKMWQSLISGNNTNRSKLHHEEIKGRLNSGNACYYSFQSLLFSCLLSRNVEVKICKL